MDTAGQGEGICWTVEPYFFLASLLELHQLVVSDMNLIFLVPFPPFLVPVSPSVVPVLPIPGVQPCAQGLAVQHVGEAEAGA